MKSGEQITKNTLKVRQIQDKSKTISDQRIIPNPTMCSFGCISILKMHLEGWWIFCCNSPLRYSLAEKKTKKTQDKDQSWFSLEHAHAPALSGMNFYFLLNSMGPHEPCSQESSGQWQLDLGWPPDPVSKAPFSLTSQWANRSPTWAHFFPITFLGAKAEHLLGSLLLLFLPWVLPLSHCSQL